MKKYTEIGKNYVGLGKLFSIYPFFSNIYGSKIDPITRKFLTTNHFSYTGIPYFVILKFKFLCDGSSIVLKLLNP